jgi:hypothetical protein
MPSSPSTLDAFRPLASGLRSLVSGLSSLDAFPWSPTCFFSAIRDPRSVLGCEAASALDSRLWTLDAFFAFFLLILINVSGFWRNAGTPQLGTAAAQSRDS